MLSDCWRFAKTAQPSGTVPMVVGTPIMPERLAELLAVRAVADLSPDEQAELDRLISLHPEVDPFAYQLSLPPVPASLRARLLQRAAQDRPQQTSLHWGWWLAAILSLVALVIYVSLAGN